MSLTTILVQFTSYEDLPATSNPTMRTVDWKRMVRDLASGRPVTERCLLAPGETRTIWDGSRTIGFDATTQLALATSPLDASRYRLSWTSTGTNPAFRTDRGYNPNGASVTLTLNANATITVTSSGGAPSYASIQVGDEVLIPGVDTGDVVGPFDTTPTPGIYNTGRWVILSKTVSSFTMTRPAGDAFVGVTQTVVCSANSQVQVFSAAGAKVGDVLELSAGFAAGALKGWPVLSVAPTYIEIQSTLPVGAETAIPGANGLKVYSDAKCWVYVESDQEIVAQQNGDTSLAFGRVVPVQTGDATVTIPGMLLRSTNAWKLAVHNPGSVAASVFVIGVGPNGG